MASVLIALLADRVTSSLRTGGDGYPEMVRSRLKLLDSSLKAIRAAVRTAELRRMENVDPEHHWKCSRFINRVKDDAYDAEDVLDKLEYRLLQRRAAAENQVRNFVKRVITNASCFPCCSHDLKDLREIVDRFDERVAGIGEFLESVGLDGVLPEQQAVGASERAASTQAELEPVGRDREKKCLLDLLTANYPTESCLRVAVIAIIGMGGVGKTTLAQWVYYDRIVKGHFDLRAWVSVAKKFEPARLMTEMLDSACIDRPHARDSDQNLDSIYQIVCRGLAGKRFLVVLDDFCEVDASQWEILLTTLRCGKEGSKVLVTTRDTNVARAGSGVRPIHLGGLTRAHCLSFFQQCAFGEEIPGDYPVMEAIASNIVSVIKGFPLEVKMVGAVLRSNFSESHWRSIWHRYSKLISSGSQFDPILQSLRISYDYLPEQLKQCFVYCSLFPEDYGFEKDRLVRIWIALGFILQRKGKKLEDTGREYFEELIQRSFFQKKQHQDGYVIHDVVHDLGNRVAHDEYLASEDHPWRSRIRSKIRHLNIYDGNLEVFRKRICGMKHMHSLIIHGGFNTDGLVDILKELKGLRVLILSQVSIKLLPDSIRNLIHLRYLELHKVDVAELPESMCRLYHLEALDVRYCVNLLTMPRGLHNLLSLRHLKL